MIAYEELEKALARWKARRAGVGVVSAEASAMTTGSENVAGMVAQTAASFQTRESLDERERTGEIDLADALLDEI